MEGDHVLRYIWVAQFTMNCEVTDIGCGHGYGSNYLAENGAKNVIGIDVDERAIDFARSKYARNNLTFELMDATRTTIEAETIDVVVSFEVIEHLTEVGPYLQEIHRILRPGGRYVLSTPNKLNTEGTYVNGKSPNPFHVREFYPHELESTLSESFEIEKVCCEFRKSDLARTPDEMKRFNELSNYSRACPIPVQVRRLLPDSFKNVWLRFKGFPEAHSPKGKWKEYEIRERNVEDIDYRYPVQIFVCRR